LGYYIKDPISGSQKNNEDNLRGAIFAAAPGIFTTYSTYRLAKPTSEDKDYKEFFKDL
jgi:hypothetical protein